MVELGFRPRPLISEPVLNLYFLSCIIPNLWVPCMTWLHRLLHQRVLENEHHRHGGVNGVGLGAREDNRVSLEARGLRGIHLSWGPFNREETLKCFNIQHRCSGLPRWSSG